MAIVKVQRPLMPTDGPWCVYGKGRQNMRLVAPDKVPRPVKEAMGDDLKAYFHARWDQARGIWMMGQRTTEQDW